MVTYNEPFTSEINRKVKVASCTHAFYLGLPKSLFMLGPKTFE